MITPITKNCDHCGNEYQAKHADAKYCSNRCKVAAFNKRKKLAGLNVNETPLTETQTPMQPTPMPVITRPVINLPAKREPETKLPASLDVSAKWVIDQQKERIDDLKADLKDRTDEVKRLTAERVELEKKITALETELNAKPTGLSGFATNNPGIVEKAMDLFGPKLLQLVEKLEPKQLGGGDHPVWQWLIAQTPEVQQDFVDLISGLNTKPEQIRDYLARFKRELIAVAQDQPKTVGRVR